MKIAVIELDVHVECLYSFCKIFERSDRSVTIYTKDAIYNELKHEQFIGSFEWRMKSDKESKQEFLESHLETINHHDIVFISTVSTEIKVYAQINFEPFVILRIHNINTWLNWRKNIRFKLSLNELLKDASYIVREFIVRLDWIYKKKLLNNLNCLELPSENIVRYVRESRIDNGIRVGAHIPVAVFDHRFIKKNVTDQIVISVPGSVDQRRRDYQLLYEAFTQVIPELKKTIMLNFLGKTKGSYGDRIVRRFSRLDTPEFKFKYHRNRIPHQIYTEEMKNTDILLAPILLDTRYKIYYEKYGYSKLAAVESDIVRYGKPAILPAGYPIEPRLRPLIDTFSSEDELAQLILDYANKDLLEEKQERIRPTLSPFGQKYIIDQIDRFFSSLIVS